MASKEKVLTDFTTDLLKTLPLADDNIDIFLAILQKGSVNLLPGNTKDTLKSKPTWANRAAYLVDLVRNGIELYFPKLIKAMEEYSTTEHDENLRKLTDRMQAALGKSTYSATHNIHLIFVWKWTNCIALNI